jgi:hypothetical protein
MGHNNFMKSTLIFISRIIVGHINTHAKFLEEIFGGS